MSREKAITLQTRLVGDSGEWLVLSDDPRFSTTNNLAERALRPLVALRKITYGERSDTGARRMATLLSVGETASRHGHRASDIYFQLYTRPPTRVLRRQRATVWKKSQDDGNNSPIHLFQFAEAVADI
ncbi:MAG: transposase [Planctomycetaceae bacterium]|nr:transposase [Planctomycetales bacterium]MCB9921625.1 transposase [Planctomycetaceae bacterium]